MASSSNRFRLPGGIWDKLGNRYESLWTVDALLSVLRGEAQNVTVEPHGTDGEGIEFVKELADGTREFFSAKRQNAANIWSLANLTSPKETGRSILGDLFNRLGEDLSNRAVFVSATTANKLLRLCQEAENSHSAELFEQSVRGNDQLANEADEYLIQKLRVDWPTLWSRLKRLTVRGTDEKTLREWLERIIERDLVHTDGSSISPASARLLLYELIYSSFRKPISRDDIISHLATEQLTPRDWSRPTKDHEILERRNRLYVQDVEAELIQKPPIPRAEVGSIIDALETGISTVLVAGNAGLGKSCVLTQCLRAFEERQIPHLAIRLDTQTDVRSTLAFGQQLGFSLSPASVLSGVSRGRRSVLIIDQLDALSITSGRNPLLWEVFRELLFEAKHFGGIQLLLACRAYDLDNDSRLRTLVTENQGKRIDLNLLPVETVRNLLGEIGAPRNKFQPRHIELLRTPLHLSVFLLGEPKSAEPATDLTQLYDRYWQRKSDNANTRTPRPIRFEQTIQRLAHVLSERQTLSASKDIFDVNGLSFDAQALASDHVLVFEDSRCRFFHETFFDYTFARNFVASGKRLVPDLLPEGTEQHLFRRGQVRQVLAYQRGRDGGFSQYLSDLQEILEPVHNFS